MDMAQNSLKLTLDQVIKDIAAGRSTKIYLCPKSMWWTHLESDLVKGKTPLGYKVNVNPNPLRFINKSKSMPEWYGKHRLDAFMKAHAQNCEQKFSNKWDKYNDLIDNKPWK